LSITLTYYVAFSSLVVYSLNLYKRVRDSRTAGPRRPATLPRGETPLAPIRGLPRPWTGL